jgi:hypothetical protein
VTRASILVLSIILLCACSSNDSAPAGGYAWTATAAETKAVGAAREVDAQAAEVWAAYSDGLVLHYMYDFCGGLEAASDVEEFLNERAQARGEAVLLPLVVGSPYLCPGRADAVGAWIAEQAANE